MKSTIIYFHFCSRRSYNMGSHAVLYVISPFVLPFLHSVMHQILMEYGKLKINAKIKDWELLPLRSVSNGRPQFL